MTTSQASYSCYEINQHSHDIYLIKMRSTSEQPIIHESGQYIEVHLDNHVLPLSIANAPNKEGILEFHLRTHQHDIGMQSLLNAIKQEQPLLLKGPLGQSTLSRAEPGNTLVFLGGGTGFAPIRAILGSLFEKPITRDLFLYWGIRKPQDAYQIALLEQWRSQFPQFNYTVVLSEPDLFNDWNGATGLVHEYCAKSMNNFNNACVFASGPFQMVKSAFDLYTQIGLKESQFITDFSFYAHQR